MWQFWSFVVTDGLITEGRGFGETEQIIKTQVFWMEIWGSALLDEEQLDFKKVTAWWAPHDTEFVCKLEAILLFFSYCLWRLPWILKNQILLLLLPPPFLPWRLRGAIVVHTFPRLWPAPGPATQHQQQGSALWKRSLVQSVGSSGCLL